MGKRSDKPRIPQDFYPTPISAVKALVSHLPQGITYAEVCAGTLDLVIALAMLRPDINCVALYDIEQRDPAVTVRDAGEPWSHAELNDADILITNPPWQRREKNDDGKMIPYKEQPLIKILMALIATGKPVWLLLDSDWAFTVGAAPYLKYCHSIIAVGRVKWIPGSENTGMDNASWYGFSKFYSGPAPLFYGREIK